MSSTSPLESRRSSRIQALDGLREVATPMVLVRRYPSCLGEVVLAAALATLVRT